MPLDRSGSKASVGKNIARMMHEPGKLTAKGKMQKHKQAIAIALDLARRASVKRG